MSTTSITITGLVSNQGTIVVFEGETDDGVIVQFGVDWRPARDIAQALEEGEIIEVDVADWQILSRGAIDL